MANRVVLAALLGLAATGAPTTASRAQEAQAAEAEPLPPLPAAGPPAPARLDARPGPQAGAAPAPGLPGGAAPLAGLEALPDGAWRLRFASATADAPPPRSRAALVELGRRLAARPPLPSPGRVTVVAQASGPAADVSAARRLTLARALAVKEALAAGGLPDTRIDVRPMGRTEEALDAVDVLPPEAQRAPAAAARPAARPPADAPTPPPAAR